MDCPRRSRRSNDSRIDEVLIAMFGMTADDLLEAKEETLLEKQKALDAQKQLEVKQKDVLRRWRTKRDALRDEQQKLEQQIADGRNRLHETSETFVASWETYYVAQKELQQTIRPPTAKKLHRNFASFYIV